MLEIPRRIDKLTGSQPSKFYSVDVFTMAAFVVVVQEKRRLHFPGIVAILAG